jgi:hypothetical protein
VHNEFLSSSGHSNGDCGIGSQDRESAEVRFSGSHEEELYLFTYDPFSELGVPPLPGPVYIHADACKRSDGADSIPAEYRGRLLTLAAYGSDRKLIEERRLTGGNEDEEAKRLFAHPDVQYIQVRSTEAGCYLFRLERRG